MDIDLKLFEDFIKNKISPTCRLCCYFRIGMSYLFDKNEGEEK